MNFINKGFISSLFLFILIGCSNEGNATLEEKLIGVLKSTDGKDFDQVIDYDIKDEFIVVIYKSKKYEQLNIGFIKSNNGELEWEVGIKDGSNFFSMSQFADYLNNQGLRYDRQKLNLYFERGKVPQPDLIVGGIKYWSGKTVQKYYEQEKIRMRSANGEKLKFILKWKGAIVITLAPLVI